MEHKNSSANSININYATLITLAFLVDLGQTNLNAKQKPYKYNVGDFPCKSTKSVQNQLWTVHNVLWTYKIHSL